MEIRFDVLDAIKKLNPDYILIVSNQGGIESGFVDEYNFQAKSEYIGRAIREYCVCECYIAYCQYNDKSNKYRKPNAGMLELLTEKYVGDDFDFIKSRSLMIGDASGKDGQFSDSDKKTAENFGIDYMDVNDFVRYWEDKVMTPSEIYDITNPYASGCSVRQATIKPSTSADGWKYHKRKK